jgi:nucleotide-binding universal stress UspA family protein
VAETPRRNGRIIVAGYDGSATGKAAVDYAARKAGAGGHVFVVHAYGLGEPGEHGRALIDGLALEDDPLIDTEWDAELIEGRPAQVLLSVAHARHADEIVVGSRGRGRLTRAALGSVSHELLSRSDLPVVVIPQVPE